MKKWSSFLESIFKDDFLQGEEDILTEEEIEGYSFCSGNKEKCAIDCGVSVLLPTITGTN